MPSQSRKHRGYDTQRIVASYLVANGFPHAYAIGAGQQGSDVQGTVGIDWEVYARRGLKITEKLTQQLRRLPDGVLPVGVLRPDGWGPARVADWPAIVPLGHLVPVLRDAGFGDPVSVESQVLYDPLSGHLLKEEC